MNRYAKVANTKLPHNCDRDKFNTIHSKNAALDLMNNLLMQRQTN